MATDAQLIRLTNAVKLAAVALAEANRRCSDARAAWQFARADAEHAAEALGNAEQELLSFVRAEQVSA